MNNQIQVKVSGQKPQNNVLKACIPASITGTKVTFTHRYTTKVGTGVEVEIPEGFKLCFSLVPELAARGMVLLNAPGNVKSGKVEIALLNAGREIVDIKHGDPIADCWIEPSYDIVWSD